jgi:hypothetical protein
VIRSQGRVVFLAYFALKPVLIYTLVVAPTRRYFLGAIIFYLLGILPSFLLGSKGALLIILVDSVLVFYLRGLFLQINNGFFSIGRIRGFGFKYLLYLLIFTATAIPIAPLGLSLTGVAPDYSTASVILYNRFLAGFDSVFFSVDAGLKVGSADYAFLNWWFASPMKVLGIYPELFNGVNHFIMFYYWGPGADAGGMFPNNFQVLEVMLSVPMFIGVAVLAVSGLFLSFLISFLCRRRLLSPVYAIFFIILISSPFSMLIDGQSFWTNIFIWIPFLFFVKIMIFLFGGKKV